jgi:hypothetical protein
MLTLKNFFNGMSTLDDIGSGGDSIITRDITIGTVTDVNRTLIFYTWSQDYDMAFTESESLSVSLYDASTIRVMWRKTFALDSAFTIRWWVFEFSEGVQTQHYFSTTMPTSPITINAVDTSRSFLKARWMLYGSEGVYTQVNAGANFSFASSTSVTLTNGGSWLYNVAMQIVQWDGAAAQHAIANINASTPVDVTINAVNMPRALLTSSSNWTSGSDPTSVDQYARCFLNSSTAVRLSTITTGYSQDIALTVIEIPQFYIQRGLAAFDTISATATLVELIAAVTIPWMSMSNRPWAQRNESTTPYIYGGAHACLMTFNSSTELNIARGRAWSEINADWQVIEFYVPPPRYGFVNYQIPAIV